MLRTLFGNCSFIFLYYLSPCRHTDSTLPITSCNRALGSGFLLRPIAYIHVSVSRHCLHGCRYLGFVGNKNPDTYMIFQHTDNSRRALAYNVAKLKSLASVFEYS